MLKARTKGCLHSSTMISSKQLPSLSSPTLSSEIDRICRLINDHPFPNQPLRPALLQNPTTLFSPSLIETVLARLFSGHVNGLKALEFFNFTLQHAGFRPTSGAFEKILHILARMKDFDRAWELISKIHQTNPSLITLKSMSILLSRVAKFRSFEETLEAFERMTRFIGGELNTEAFNVLLRAFCTQRQIKEARAVFCKMHGRFSPNTQSLNILLLGFKESGNLLALELFYHELIRRGCEPNRVSYNIRIDALCKKGRVSDAFKLAEEMEERNFLPGVETFTTLIHGWAISRDPARARQTFDKMIERNLQPDVASYNALIGSYVRVGNLKSGIALMNEMVEKGIACDNVTYHTMFWGLKNSSEIGGFCELYRRMVDKNWVPKTCTVVMLMRFFCENDLCDLGLELWEYLIQNGCCPHGHVLDLLIKGLCCRGKLNEAYECFKQVLVRGRHPYKQGFRVLEQFLLRAGEVEKLGDLVEMMNRLQAVVAVDLECFLTSKESDEVLSPAL